MAALGASATPAAAGEYPINACQSDRLNYSTQAFDTFATRGMKWARKCNPVGPGLRGLITGNVVRGGRVARGAQARYVLEAPAGTRFVRFRWSGKLRRRDCRYALQLYADRPDGSPIAIKNVRAGRRCPKRGRAQASGLPRPHTYDVAGATRIVQRAVCVGGEGRRFCSARGLNYIRTFQAQAVVSDVSGPSVAIVPDNPFTQGAWVSRAQVVSYTASDNVGVKLAQAVGAAGAKFDHPRACDYTRRIPCTNEPGQIRVDTMNMSEGTQSLQVIAVDAADNWNASQPVTVRVDNTPPGAVPVSLDGGDGWRSSNDFDAVWQNPDEGDRAPIAAADWRLCRAASNQCSTGAQRATGIARLADLAVPAPGAWELRMWRTDAAGNSQPANASPPVTLRYDPEPPQLGFEASPGDDPTKVVVSVNERVSAVAGGAIELSREGSGAWQTLATQLDGPRLVARIDDARLPPGRYLLRAQATDLAGNVGVAAAPQPLTLPLRIESTMRAGVERTRVVRVRVRRRTVRRRVTVLRPRGRVRYGGHVIVGGVLTNRDGQPLAGQQIQVLGPSPNGDQLLAVLTTDAKGRYRYRAAGLSGGDDRRAVPARPLGARGPTPHGCHRLRIPPDALAQRPPRVRRDRLRRPGALGGKGTRTARRLSCGDP